MSSACIVHNPSAVGEILQLILKFDKVELGLFRPTKLRAAPQRRFGLEYMEDYFKHFPKSEPAEDWDLRNRLYSL